VTPIEFRTEGAHARIAWSWLPEDRLEADTLAQIRNIASLPTAVAVAVMPYAVGVDIGCGKVAIKTDLAVDAVRARVADALTGIYERVPVGMPTKRDRRQGSHASRQDSETLRAWIDTRAGEPNAKEIRERADRQLGTLGSGNPYRLALIRQAALRQASRDRAGVVRALPHAAARQGAGVPRLRRGRRSRVLRGHAVRNALRRGITRAHRDRLSRPTCSARSP